MTAQTADQALVLPVGAGTDLAEVPSHLTRLNGRLESRLVKRYVDEDDRAARNPHPDGGDLCWLQDPARYEFWHDGAGAWWELLPVYAFKANETQTFPTNSGFNDGDDQMTITFRPNAWYELEWHIVYDASLNGKFDWSHEDTDESSEFGAHVFWRLDSGSTTNTGAQRLDGEVSRLGNMFYGGGAIALGTFLPLRGRGAVNTVDGGHVTFQWGQLNSDAGPARIKIGSFMKATRMG